MFYYFSLRRNLLGFFIFAAISLGRENEDIREADETYYDSIASGLKYF